MFKEMHSGSVGDSLNGLTFGEKVYFEDLGGGGGGGSGGGSSSRSTTAVSAARKGKGVQQGGQPPPPPRCQVEGCHVDLTGAKAYYCRHKVCGMHSKAPKVVVNGMEQRFCQQCSRFHQLSEFDQGKRSCRRRLAGHNERRRKPPLGPLSRNGRFSSPFPEGRSGYRGFLMDFTYPRLPCSAREVWPTVRASDRVPTNIWHGNLDDPQGEVAVQEAQSYVQYPDSGAELQPGQCLTGVSDSSCALSLLSTQPWDTAASRNRAMSLSANSSFDGTPMAQPVISSYLNIPWGFKGHGASNSSHVMQQEMGLGHATDGGTCQYSGELELALQGNRQCPVLDPSRAYDQTGHGLHWSL